jgi:hypothetical protein
MLQVFHVDLEKVDRDVAYVAMAKRLFQMLQLFQTDVAHVLSGCCICFTHMLQVVYPDVAYFFTQMLQVFHLDGAYVLATHVFPSCFRRMLQVFQLFRAYVAIPLDVAKVDLVLHIL